MGQRFTKHIKGIRLCFPKTPSNEDNQDFTEDCEGFRAEADPPVTVAWDQTGIVNNNVCFTRTISNESLMTLCSLSDSDIYNSDRSIFSDTVATASNFQHFLGQVREQEHSEDAIRPVNVTWDRTRTVGNNGFLSRSTSNESIMTLCSVSCSEMFNTDGSFFNSTAASAPNFTHVFVQVLGQEHPGDAIGPVNVTWDQTSSVRNNVYFPLTTSMLTGNDIFNYDTSLSSISVPSAYNYPHIFGQVLEPEQPEETIWPITVTQDRTMTVENNIYFCRTTSNESRISVSSLSDDDSFYSDTSVSKRTANSAPNSPHNLGQVLDVDYAEEAGLSVAVRPDRTRTVKNHVYFPLNESLMPVSGPVSGYENFNPDTSLSNGTVSSSLNSPHILERLIEQEHPEEAVSSVTVTQNRTRTVRIMSASHRHRHVNR